MNSKKRALWIRLIGGPFDGQRKWTVKAGHPTPSSIILEEFRPNRAKAIMEVRSHLYKKTAIGEYTYRGHSEWGPEDGPSESTK